MRIVEMKCQGQNIQLFFIGILSFYLAGCSALFGRPSPAEQSGGEIARGAKRVKSEAESQPAEMGRRRALLIANSGYEQEAQLRTPKRDVALVQEKLEGLGYEVRTLHDLGGVRMRQAVKAFSEELNPQDEAYFHYAGHGIEVEGEAMLQGVDFSATEKSEALYQGYHVSAVVSQFSRAKRAVVVIDACRSNPFARSIFGARDGVTRGLPSQVSVDPELGEGSGVYLVFSTTKGEVAQDGSEVSPFVEAFGAVVDEHAHEPIQDLFSGHVQPRLMKRGQKLATRTFGVWRSYTLRRPDESCPVACRPGCKEACVKEMRQLSEFRAREERAKAERQGKSHPTEPQRDKQGTLSVSGPPTIFLIGGSIINYEGQAWSTFAPVGKYTAKVLISDQQYWSKYLEIKPNQTTHLIFNPDNDETWIKNRGKNYDDTQIPEWILNQPPLCGTSIPSGFAFDIETRMVLGRLFAEMDISRQLETRIRGEEYMSSSRIRGAYKKIDGYFNVLFCLDSYQGPSSGLGKFNYLKFRSALSPRIHAEIDGILSALVYHLSEAIESNSEITHINDDEETIEITTKNNQTKLDYEVSYKGRCNGHSDDGITYLSFEQNVVIKLSSTLKIRKIYQVTYGQREGLSRLKSDLVFYQCIPSEQLQSYTQCKELPLNDSNLTLIRERLQDWLDERKIKAEFKDHENGVNEEKLVLVTLSR